MGWILWRVTGALLNNLHQHSASTIRKCWRRRNSLGSSLTTEEKWSIWRSNSGPNTLNSMGKWTGNGLLLKRERRSTKWSGNSFWKSSKKRKYQRQCGKFSTNHPYLFVCLLFICKIVFAFYLTEDFLMRKTIMEIEKLFDTYTYICCIRFAYSSDLHLVSQPLRRI